MNRNFKPRPMMLTLLFLLIMIPFLSGEKSRYYNSECGESPTHKYKELAKIIGEHFIFIFQECNAVVLLIEFR